MCKKNIFSSLLTLFMFYILQFQGVLYSASKKDTDLQVEGVYSILYNDDNRTTSSHGSETGSSSSVGPTPSISEDASRTFPSSTPPTSTGSPDSNHPLAASNPLPKQVNTTTLMERSTSETSVPSSVQRLTPFSPNPFTRYGKRCLKPLLCVGCCLLIRESPADFSIKNYNISPKLDLSTELYQLLLDVSAPASSAVALFSKNVFALCPQNDLFCRRFQTAQDLYLRTLIHPPLTVLAKRAQRQGGSPQSNFKQYQKVFLLVGTATAAIGLATYVYF